MKKLKIICSNCLQDEGLKLVAVRIGNKDKKICPNCGSGTGSKLNKNKALELCDIFFVRGSTIMATYGRAPAIQFNSFHKGNSSIDVSEKLQKDIKLLEQIANIGFFDYGPRMWMLGEITPLIKLQYSRTREQIIKKIIRQYPPLILKANSFVYRVRVNPEFPHSIEQYDSPPEKNLGNGRLDSKKFPVLYCSADFELCVHECRVTVEDEVYMAKLILNKDIKILDLTAEIIDNHSPFESLNLAVRFLFLAQKHSYKISREIAVSAAKYGYQGILYPSYFSFVKTGIDAFQPLVEESIKQVKPSEKTTGGLMPNLAIFGRPIKTNMITVECINRIMLNSIKYDFSFGPVLYP